MFVRLQSAAPMHEDTVLGLGTDLAAYMIQIVVWAELSHLKCYEGDTLRCNV